MAKIAADTVEDFLAKGAKKFGKGRLGHSVAKPAWSSGGFADGKITKLVFTFGIEADYAETGGGKPDAENKRAIKFLAALAKEHEGNFETYCNDAFRSWKPKDQAEEVMEQVFADKAKAVKAADAKLAELKKVLHDACLAVHRREGLMGAEPGKDGAFAVFTKPEGPSGCK